MIDYDGNIITCSNTMKNLKTLEVSKLQGEKIEINGCHRVCLKVTNCPQFCFSVVSTTEDIDNAIGATGCAAVPRPSHAGKKFPGAGRLPQPKGGSKQQPSQEPKMESAVFCWVLENSKVAGQNSDVCWILIWCHCWCDHMNWHSLCK